MDYKKLEQDLIKAKEASIQAGTGDDGGSANMDSVFLILPRAREKKVLEAIKNAGLFCRERIHWVGSGYLIPPCGCGQGNSRNRAMEAMKQSLKDSGYEVLGFYKVD